MAAPPQQFQAFTQRYPGVSSRIITQVDVSEAFDPRTLAPKDFPKPIRTTALWDTGATGSVITPKIARDLKLAPVGKIHVTHGGGKTEQLTYLVNFMLPNGVGIPGVQVTDIGHDECDFGMIIGMDIIAIGDFSLTQHGGQTCFSFRIPSGGHIDYCKGNYHPSTAGITKVGGSPPQPPNEMCACGSGRKFKKCHGARA